MGHVQCWALFEAENVEFIVREIRSAFFVLNRRATETVLGFARISLGELYELLGQERALQGSRAVPKPIVGEVVEIKAEEEVALVYGDPRPLKRSTLE